MGRDQKGELLRVTLGARLSIYWNCIFFAERRSDTTTRVKRHLIKEKCRRERERNDPIENLRADTKI